MTTDFVSFVFVGRLQEPPRYLRFAFLADFFAGFLAAFFAAFLAIGLFLVCLLVAVSFLAVLLPALRAVTAGLLALTRTLVAEAALSSSAACAAASRAIGTRYGLQLT